MNQANFLLQYFMLIALLLCTETSGYAATINVGKGYPVRTIRAAIQRAAPGDSILVHPGIYKEGNLLINKPLILKGVNYPVLDGENKHEILSINTQNATVEGFKIQNGGRSEIKDIAGILIFDSKNIRIRNNIIDNTNFGIFTQQSKHCFIENNRITAYGKNEVQSGNGINCWRSDSMYIIGNTIKGHRDGLYFEFVTHSLIWKNVSTKNIRYGIHFMFSHYDTYIGNIFEENESGVAVMYTSNVHMYNNLFLNNWGDAAYGILLKDISDSEISGNIFSENTIGIAMEGCSRVKLHKNVFRNNGWALKISTSSDDNIITRNNFIGNTFDISTSGTLVLNSFNGNYWDKYEGYDLNRDKIGDVPYRPVSMYSIIIDNNPAALMLFRSLMVTLLDKSEKLLPGVTPEQLKDESPLMRPLKL